MICNRCARDLYDRCVSKTYDIQDKKKTRKCETQQENLCCTQRKQVYIESNVHQLKEAFELLTKIMKQNSKSRQPLIPEFFLERVMKGGGGGDVERVPNPSSQPDVSPNPSYQICNPISSARLLTDAHHEVKALIDAIWIMNLHSPRPKKITHPAGEHSSSSNPC